MPFANTPGRHRKPRTSQTKRLVATASLGTAGIALPLIAATSASAASVSTWDKVASCESGGDWSINTGNGYYGGLQFSASTWSAYGGSQYASTADHATKGQQISIAEKVLASQGPGAWPVCGPKAGLSQGGAAASVSTAGSGSSSSSSSSSSASSSDSATSTTKQSSSTDSTSTSTGKHRSAAATDSASKATRKTTSTSTSTSTSTAKPQVGHGNYTVKAGDSLSAIAAAAHLKGGWTELYQDNKSTVGGNPDLIFPGQKLVVV
ncbi:transglycosylase family protein [Streptacidiphilus carbonis]|uniref:LysM peptidoglycan-binding domain-containing protein n=1 Tax=Streptacidiphilus carbonis TaxID=105422 RepID=UPI0005A87EC5|nr:transglycosylase family protein [Streptacidiphilus carbonis]